MKPVFGNDTQYEVGYLNNTLRICSIVPINNQNNELTGVSDQKLARYNGCGKLSMDKPTL